MMEISDIIEADNQEQLLAWQILNETNCSLFLTGRAGTGKTTFLKKLCQYSQKRIVVAAPTGIAAINAGGVTLHSLFQLSFGVHVPGEEPRESTSKRFAFSKEKRQVIRTMDILVIDEISMVRADLLDAVDAALRKYRNRHLPFGGVQLLLIGDLQQLSPVVTESDEQFLRSYYDSYYFFGAQALRAIEYFTIELQKVYRQEDNYFISLLNAIRDNCADEAVLQALNKRYIPDFSPEDSEGYVRLMTHNRQADAVNEKRLLELVTRKMTYHCEIKDKFPEGSYPADEQLTLKVGARVMFIKNDPSEDKAFYNGKLGQVINLDDEIVSVLCDGEKMPIEVHPLEWENVKYTTNDLGKVEEVIEGSFKQMPLRLAWAITIHKSQGLTFERAIIDAAGSFAHGQVYVALSRCKSLEGLVLRSPLMRHAIISDDTVRQFTQEQATGLPDEQKLGEMKRQFFVEQLNILFDLQPLKMALYRVQRILMEHLYNMHESQVKRIETALTFFEKKMDKVAVSFQKQYLQLGAQLDTESVRQTLLQRVHKGAEYFAQQYSELRGMLPAGNLEITNKQTKKTYKNAFEELAFVFNQQSLLTGFVAKNGFDLTTFQQARAQAIVKLMGNEPKAKKRSAQKTKNTAVGTQGVSNSSLTRRISASKSVRTSAIGSVANENTIRMNTHQTLSDQVENEALYKSLSQWRGKKAKELGRPAYTVVHTKALIAIANNRPQNAQELLALPFVGPKTVSEYGKEILDMIQLAETW